MKNLNLQSLAVQEMDKQEMKKQYGGLLILPFVAGIVAFTAGAVFGLGTSITFWAVNAKMNLH